MARLDLLAAAIALLSAAAPAYAANRSTTILEICSTLIAQTSVSSVPTSTVSTTVRYNSIVSVTVTPTATITPANVTITSTSTETDLTTTTSVVTDTDNVTLTSTAFYTPTIVITSTTNFTTTTTSTSTIPVTATSSTSAGFTPVSSEPAYQAALATSTRAPMRMEVRKPKKAHKAKSKKISFKVNSQAQLEAANPTYATAINCVVSKEIIVTKTKTRTASSVTVTATPATVTSMESVTTTSTVTEVDTGTLTVTVAQTTVTMSAYETYTSTVNVSSTSTSTATATASSVVATYYPACDPNNGNLATQLPNQEYIGGFATTNQVSISTAYNSSQACCIACLTGSNCAADFYDGTTCFFIERSTGPAGTPLLCDGSHEAATFSGDSSLAAGVITFSNSYCGQADPAV